MRYLNLSSVNILMFVFMSLFHSYMSWDLVEQSCLEAAKGDPNVHYKFCVASLKSNPKTRNATSLEQLVFISIEQAISKATNNIVPKISNLLKGKFFDEFTKSCLKSCLELYNDAISSLNDSMNDIKSMDFMKANLDLSSAVDASGTCADGFEEKKGEVSPLTNENTIFFQLNVISLAFTTMLISSHK